MTPSSKFTLFITTILFSVSIFSCSKSDSDDSTEPSNLAVTVNISDTDQKTVLITATATNVVEFQLYIDKGIEPVESNTTGEFEYTFANEGSHSISVRAFGVSGKYLKYEQQVIIGNNEVPIGEGYTTPLTYDGMQLVWNDEFNDTKINESYWSFETGAGGWGNNEWQYYRRENAWTEGGTLIIEARKESWQGSNYTSTRMVTRNKKSFQYGRVDIRALLPEGQGIWPALWMLGESFSSVGWPACGEIDIMEMIGGSGRENTVHSTLHWDDNGHVQAGGSKTLTTGTYNDKYHVFSMIWDASSMRFFVDDVQFYVINITPAHMTEFHKPAFFIFNVAVGGNWPGYPDATTQFPQQLKVDYIRVFQ